MSEQAYPLSWPHGWKRTAIRRGSNFGDQSIDRATRDMLMEIKRLGCPDWNCIISTNLRLRNDGLPISGQSQPIDTGVAVYFKLNGKPMVLACDKWTKVQDNIRAITKHVEALRGQDRWGVGSIERAFAGYAALPSPDDWRAIMLFPSDSKPTLEDIQIQYRNLAQKFHPDVPGGSHDAMARLNRGFAAAKQELSQ